MAQAKKTSRRNAAPKTEVSGDVSAAVVPQPAPAALTQSVVTAAAPAAEAGAPGNVLHLGASLSIREVADCMAKLKELLAVGPTDLDAGQLESIDTAGMQLLLAAAVAAQRRGFKLRLLNAQGVKAGAAHSLGLTEHLLELAELAP